MRIILSILVLSVCYSQDCEEGVVADDCGICGGNIFIIESEYFEYVCEDVTTCEEEWVCNNAIVGYNEQSRCNSPTGSFCTSDDQCVNTHTGMCCGFCIEWDFPIWGEYCGYEDICETETQCGNVNAGICDCDGNILDCEGICGGGKVQDTCGVCDGICTDTCDACGNCGGDCVDNGGIVCYDDPDNYIKADECGICGGDGISDNCGTCDNDLTNDCVQDECGVWGGDGILLWNECYSIESTESLQLYESGLTGQISESIGNLTNLEYLSLSENQLTGQIPESIGNLTNLEYLYLSSNQLNGEIPLEMGSLTNLIRLSLHGNQLTGPIPNEIGNLTKLESLVLSNNMFEGELPETIGELNNLYLLFVWGNQLSGKIPESIGNLTQLERLSLSSNYFYGEIPESICDLSVEWGDTTESGGSNFQIFNNKLCIPYPDCIESYMGYQECYGCMDHNACNFNSNAVGNAGNCTYSNQGFDCNGNQLSLFNGLIPENFSIHSIYPNPFNPVTSITYGLPEYINVQILVYDLSGKQVETLINEFQTPGYHSVNWNADNLSSGVYLIRMDSGDFTQTQKVVLVK